MQDYAPESTGPDAAPASVSERAARWVGAVASLGLIVGVGLWTYQLGKRDASEVPVIRALQGEARVRPDNPGGAEVEFQGLAVNEVLGGSDTAAVSLDTRLAPPPTRLAAEDVAGTGAQTESLTPEFSEPLPGAQTPDANTAPDEADVPEPADIAALAPPPELVRPPRRALPAAATIPDEINDALAAAIAEAVAAAANPDSTPASTPEADSGIAPGTTPGPTAPQVTDQGTSVEPGTRLIQIGTYDSDEEALAEWRALSAAHRDLLGALEPFVERGEAQGRIFYRLRAVGPTELEQTRALCVALLARNVQCITVTQR